MTTLSMGSKTWVLLNSERTLNEIIAKRASITNERPYFPVAGGLVSRDKRVFLQKTSEWREGRRLLHRLLMGEGSKAHASIVESASLDLVRNYANEPALWYEHNYRYTVSVIYKIMTGADLDKPAHRLRDLQNVTSTFLMSINTSPVDFFPQLSSLVPKAMQFWRRHWENLGTYHYNVFKTWWTDIMGTLHQSESFVRDVILGEYSGSEEQKMYLTMLGIAAGADNPRMTINTFIMACIAHPMTMSKAREELDALCGAQGQRLPEMKDLADLPYMCAVVKEILRWRPTVPLVPQRVLTQDLEFEGYKFPAATEFLVNTIAVCSQGYERPDEFLPERWLESGGGKGVEQDLWQFAFSAGRRSCLGYKLAQKVLFLSFARLLYCFDFEAGGEFDDRVLNAFALGEPFPVRIRLRSEQYGRLVAQGETN